MTGKAKILVVALDALDPALALSLAAAGELPTLASLLGTSATATIHNPYGLFVGTLWTSLFTACSATRTGFYSWETIDTQTYEQRLTSALDIKGTPFWETLSAAGRRVCIIDVPHARAANPINGVAISEYGNHDRHFGFHTQPPELAKEIEAEFGLHPVFTANPYEVKEWAPDDYMHRAGTLRTAEEEKALLTDMLEGVQRKARISVSLLGRGAWDLFLVVFGDGHATGHQQWHLHDPTHPRFDAKVTAFVGDPLLHVYRKLDAALGQHLALADPQTSVFVLLSHGMGPHYDGTHLLDEMLRRLDHAAGGQIGGTRFRQGVKRRLWEALPAGVQKLAMSGVIALLRRRLARHPPHPTGVGMTPEERAGRRFFLAPNNTVFGGVRINLVGREPRGLVQPGAEYDRICAQLIEDLMSFVNLKTGGPVVRAASRLEDHYDRVGDDTLPDLLIDWARDAPLETIWSPKTGVIHNPYDHWRTGDHHSDGLLLAKGPGMTPTTQPAVNILDLGTSLAARLGVDLGDVDGRPVPWIAADGVS